MISCDVCDCFNKLVSVNIGCCSALTFLSCLVCNVFLIKFPVNGEIIKPVTSSWSVFIQISS